MLQRGEAADGESTAWTWAGQSHVVVDAAFEPAR